MSTAFFLLLPSRREHQIVLLRAQERPGCRCSATAIPEISSVPSSTSNRDFGISTQGLRASPCFLPGFWLTRMGQNHSMELIACLGCIAPLESAGLRSNNARSWPRIALLGDAVVEGELVLLEGSHDAGPWTQPRAVILVAEPSTSSIAVKPFFLLITGCRSAGSWRMSAEDFLSLA